MALRYKHKYGQAIPVEVLVQHIADHKQSYTQFGGLGHMACLSFLQAGEMCDSLSYRFSLCCIKINRDQNLGFQLYQSDPSGNYAGWQVSRSSPVSRVQRLTFTCQLC